MNKYAIISVILGAILLAGVLIWLGQPVASQNGQNNVPSLLSSSEKVFDFGTISMSNGKVSHEFTVTNGSDKPINIRSISTSCMCTAANFKFNGKTFGPFGMPGHSGGLTAASVTINSGGTGILTAIYDPNAHGPAGVGPIDRFIYIEDKSGGTLELEIKAKVIP